MIQLHPTSKPKLIPGLRRPHPVRAGGGGGAGKASVLGASVSAGSTCTPSPMWDNHSAVWRLYMADWLWLVTYGFSTRPLLLFDKHWRRILEKWRWARKLRLPLCRCQLQTPWEPRKVVNVRMANHQLIISQQPSECTRSYVTSVINQHKPMKINNTQNGNHRKQWPVVINMTWYFHKQQSTHETVVMSRAAVQTEWATKFVAFQRFPCGFVLK